MTALNYSDFDLVIERRDNSYTARVQNSPVGPATATFEAPFAALEIENFLLRLGAARRGMRRVDAPEMEAAKDFGGRLFNSVFSGEIRQCFLRSLDQVSGQEGGLRVRLHLTSVPELADLPWEFLYHNSTFNRFLSLSVNTPVVRYVDLPERIRPLSIKPPLNVLVTISSPTDFPALDVEREWASLSQALADLQGRGLVNLERLPDSSLASLQRQLRRKDWHIFHFVGHGGFDKAAQDGVLVFEDEFKRGRKVSGQDLGAILHNHRPLRLAVLNACEGGRAAVGDPYSGTAQSLLQQDIPAVIGMQFEISDDSAICFAQEFYGAVADGYPVDAALAEARLAIRARSNDVEWGTPVLYLRAADGRVFDIDTSGAKPDTAEASPKSDESRRKLQLLYTQGLSHFYIQQWDEAIAVLGQVVAENPTYEDAASKLREATRQRDLANLYANAIRAFDAKDWDAAVTRLEAVLQSDPGHAGAATRIVEARRRKTLKGLYAEAARLYQAQQWDAVVNVFESIRAEDPSCPDPEGWLANSRREIEANRRRQRLETLYRDGLREMDGGNWQQAQVCFSEIERTQPGYHESAALLARTRELLAKDQPTNDQARRQTPADDVPQHSPEKADADPTLRPASWGARLGATLIDILILLVPYLILLAISQDFGSLLAIGVEAAYFIYFWSTGGQTVGHKALHLRVVRTNGKPLDTSAAFLRYLGWLLSLLPLGLGFLWALWDPKQQGWHDKIASTYVVQVS